MDGHRANDRRAEARGGEAAGNLLAMLRIYHDACAFEDVRSQAPGAIAALSGRDRIEAQVLLANALLVLRRVSEARALREAMPPVDEAELKVELHLLDARLWCEEGRYDECCSRFDGAWLEERIRCARTRGILRLGLVVAECHRWRNELAAAHAGCKRVLTAAQRLDWKEGLADGLTLLALLDRMEGRWERAEALLSRALELYRETGSALGRVHATVDLGLQRLWAGKFRLALETLNDAVVLAAQLGGIQGGAMARAGRALCRLRIRRLEEETPESPVERGDEWPAEWTAEAEVVAPLLADAQRRFLTTSAREDLATALRLVRHGSPRRLAITCAYAGELHLAAAARARGAESVRHRLRARRALDRALRVAVTIAPEGGIVPGVLPRVGEQALIDGRPDDALRLARDAGRLAGGHRDRCELALALRVQGEALRAGAEAQVEGDELRALVDASPAPRDGSGAKEEIGETGLDPSNHALRRALEILEELGEQVESRRVRRLLEAPSPPRPRTPAHGPPEAMPERPAAGGDSSAFGLA